MVQKIVNLYLKILWTDGDIEAQPPHCPFVRGIIEALGEDLSYTRLVDEAAYRRLVDLARARANQEGLTIAEWELVRWNRRP